MPEENITSTILRAAIYARISEDPRGLENGVSRQLDDCDKLAGARGWKVVATYTDNDISALKGQERPGYDEMMTDAVHGEFDRIVSYGLSRLWRNRKERAEAIDTLSKARISVALVKGSDLDLTSAAGRMYAGVLGEFDTAESEIKAERVARAARQRAEEGRANGACAYGWKRVYQRDEQGRVVGWKDEVDEPAAEVVRSIVRDLLAGVTLRAVTARLNAEGSAAPLGGRWITSSVRKIAVRDLNVGIRRHGKDTYQGAWEPIVDEETTSWSRRCCPTPSGGLRGRLLVPICLPSASDAAGSASGALVVVAGKDPRARSPRFTYARTGVVWADARIGSTSWSSPPFASGSRSRMRFRFSTPTTRRWTQARQRVAELRARLDGAADAYAAGLIDTAQLTRITQQVRPALEEAERRARPATSIPTVVQDLMDADDTRKAWDQLGISQRRAILESLQIEVVVKPSRGGPGFKQESRVDWVAEMSALHS